MDEELFLLQAWLDGASWVVLANSKFYHNAQFLVSKITYKVEFIVLKV